MNTPPNRFTLLDDGSFNTVVICSDCGEELWYDYHIASEKDYEAFITWALADADAEHICNETP